MCAPRLRLNHMFESNFFFRSKQQALGICKIILPCLIQNVTCLCKQFFFCVCVCVCFCFFVFFLYGLYPELLLTVNQIQAHEGLKRMLILIVQHKTVANFHGKPPFQKNVWILLIFVTLECQLRF